jgi:peroxiredoxin
VQQLGELQRSADALRQQADAYVINGDTPPDSQRLKQLSRISLPVLLDPSLDVARRYDMLPKPDQPMGGMTGVAQMGFVVVDAGGTIRVQRADVNFGRHAGQLLEILRLLGQARG